MAPAYEHYFLQARTESGWETLERRGAPDGLRAAARARLGPGAEAACRIVGAAYDEDARAWTYAQLFRIDRLAPGAPAARPAPARAAASRVRAAAGATDMRLAYFALAMGGAIALLSFGIRSGFGLYLGPISLELGQGRETFALALAMQNLVWGVTQPFAGALADRVGPFRSIALGAVFYAAGLLLMSQSGTPEMFHLSAGLLIGIGLSGTSITIVLGAVGQLFPAARRSWALGVVGAAGSLGQFLVVPATQQLLDGFGWSGAAAITAIAALAMAPLGLAFLKARPVAAVAAGPEQTVRAALAEAALHPSFWLLVGGFFVCGFHVTFIAVHLPSYVSDIGLSPETGAWALGIVGLFNVVGSYMAGVLGGRFPKKYLLSALYLGRAVLMAGLLLLPASEAVVYVFAALLGFVWLGVVPLTSGLVADNYGLRHMSMLFGIVFLGHQLGGFLGSWMGGLAFDLTGAYDIVWWISIVLALASAALHWPIRALPRMAAAPA